MGLTNKKIASNYDSYFISAEAFVCPLTEAVTAPCA